MSELYRRFKDEILVGGDPNESPQWKRTQSVLHFAPLETPQPRTKTHEELGHLHPSQPCRDEVAHFVEEHGDEQSDDEEQCPWIA